MSFEDNKQFWQEFIALYEQTPCLWDSKNKKYRNKQLKNVGYEALVAKCKELFPNANKDFVMKKIASLRSSFRRQIRRLEDAKRSGSGAEEVPEATLWYFDLMAAFLLDQEASGGTVSSVEDNHTEFLDIDTHDFKQDLSSPEATQSYGSCQSSSSRKRTYNNTTWSDKRDDFIDSETRAVHQEGPLMDINIVEPQETTFGKNVGQQLQEVEKRQKIIAQKLISDVLFHAKLGHLNDSSIISIVPHHVHHL